MTQAQLDLQTQLEQNTSALTTSPLFNDQNPPDTLHGTPPTP